VLGWLATAEAADLRGTWRLEMEVRSTAELPVVRATSTTVTVAVVTVAADGDGLAWTHRACSVEIREANPFASTELPTALVEVLPPTTSRAEVEGDALRVDLGTSHLGYDPAVTGGALPTDRGAPGVLDVDGDGRPGATVLVTLRGLGVYGLEVVQRSRAVLAGVLDQDSARGTVATTEFAQVVLAADHPWLRKTPPVRHDDADSTFRLTRLPDGAGCAEALVAGGSG
jgi:hypothetical protein